MRLLFSRKSIVLLMVMLLFGCDRRFAPKDVFESYVNDLNRSELMNIDLDFAVTWVALPELRERQQELSQFDVGLLEFLSLQRCDVGALAGQRNSILGRVMPTSQRFVYELDIIRAIRSCDISDQELKTKLLHIAQVKERELPKALANVLWAGEETQALFTMANGFLPMAPEHSQYQDLRLALQDLVHIANQLDAIPKITSTRLENDMKAIYESEYMGKLLYSIIHIRLYLEAVTQAVKELDNRSSSDVCGAPLNFIRKQFERHYVQVLQPYMARINQVAYDVLPLMQQLQSRLVLSTPDWLGFIGQFDSQNERSEWQRYLQASRSHGQAWSSVLSRCAQSFS